MAVFCGKTAVARGMQYSRAMTRLFRLGLVSAALVVAGACGGTSTESSPTAPTPITSTPSTPSSPSGGSCNTTVSNVPSSAPASGGRFVFSIATGSGCTWTARADVPWADVAPGTGTGSGSSTLTIDESTARDSRTATLTVNGQAFRVVQGAIGCSYSLSRTSFEVGGDGGSASVGLSATPGCAWTAVASESWVRVLTTSGSGSATIEMEIAFNSGDTRRSFVTIAGQRLEIIQARR